MKKYFLLFAAGGILTLASCGGEATPTETINVDSLAQVKVDSMAAIEKAKSDSTLLATAQTTADSLMQVMREDSIAAAAAKAAGKKVPAKKVIQKVEEKKVETTVTDTKVGGMKGSSDQNQNAGGMKAKSDQNKQQQQQQGGGMKAKSDQNK